MLWRNYLTMSPEALQLEALLKPNVIEHKSGLKSTANTRIEVRAINLDISQAPLKCALSYAYELKNLENAEKYASLAEKAKWRLITKSEYVNSVIRLEAEAAYFRTRVFKEINTIGADFPCNKVFLDLYDSTINMTKEDALKAFARIIAENGVVRREYSVKKFYSDCYDFFSNKKPWPSSYDEPRSRSVIVLKDNVPNPMSGRSLG